MEVDLLVYVYIGLAVNTLTSPENRPHVKGSSTIICRRRVGNVSLCIIDKGITMRVSPPIRAKYRTEVMRDERTNHGQHPL